MGAQDDVVLMTPDPGLATRVEAVLGSNGRAASRTTVRSLRELLQHLGRTPPAVALVDLDPDPRPVLAELERASLRYPGVRFVALSGAMTNELLLSAMQSGVRHVVLKQSVAGELPDLMHRLTAGAGGTAGNRGTVIVVLSAGGGCGATTLAANLADQFAARAGKPALLIDLDASYGTLATYLGVEAQYGIDYVLSYEGRIDRDLISSAATVCNDRLHLLPSPASINFSAPGQVTADRLEQVLDAAAQAYEFVVVDAPRVPMDVAAALAAVASRTLLAFQLVVKDLRVARAMVAALAERGVAPDAVVPVVTRYAKRHHMISLDDASQALGGAAVACVRNDYQAATHAMNFGKTLAESAPRSPLRKDVQDLADRVAPVAADGAR